MIASIGSQASVAITIVPSAQQATNLRSQVTAFENTRGLTPPPPRRSRKALGRR
ncbi:MAG TPA: hypothetical protein VH643_01230 [Gemmataceae bacterium]